MRKALCLLLCLLLPLGFGPGASAAENLRGFSPTPSPTSTPTPSPTPTPSSTPARRIHEHIRVSCRQHGGWTPLRFELIYSHEGPIYADGILFFSGVDAYVARYNGILYETSAAEDPWYRVDYDASALDSFSWSIEFYGEEEGGLSLMKNEENKPLAQEELKPGRYLAMITVSGSRGEEYSKGAYLVWVTIP